jgi:hypothetical protein
LNAAERKLIEFGLIFLHGQRGQSGGIACTISNLMPNPAVK